MEGTLLAAAANTHTQLMRCSTIWAWRPRLCTLPSTTLRNGAVTGSQSAWRLAPLAGGQLPCKGVARAWYAWRCRIPYIHGMCTRRVAAHYYESATESGQAVLGSGRQVLSQLGSHVCRHALVARVDANGYVTACAALLLVWVAAATHDVHMAIAAPASMRIMAEASRFLSVTTG